MPGRVHRPDRLPVVALHRLSSTDAFLIVDLDGAVRADGVVRAAPKVLTDGASTMARSRTYSWALLGEQVSGASAGINTSPEQRSERIAAFVAEVAGRVEDGTLSLDAAKGVSDADLLDLVTLDHRRRDHAELHDELLTAGILAAAEVALGRLSGASVVIEGAGTATDALSGAFTREGAEVVDVGDGPEVASTDAELLVCGSKLGLVDHDLAAALPQRAIIPCGPAPLTAKGLAVASRRSIVVMADFLTLTGPLLAFRPSEDMTRDSLRAAAGDRVREIAAEVLHHPEGPYLGAAHRAEEFLRSWRDEVPFGRPLA